MRNEKGLTLPELMMVVAIISTVVATASPYYLHSLDKAKEIACIANLAIIDQAAQIDNIESGALSVSYQEVVGKGYFRREPYEPFGGSYSIDGDHSVCSLGHTY